MEQRAVLVAEELITAQQKSNKEVDTVLTQKLRQFNTKDDKLICHMKIYPGSLCKESKTVVETLYQLLT